jgi:hypothetical protein
MEWFKCSEVLPQDFEEYLVYLTNETIRIAYHVPLGFSYIDDKGNMITPEKPIWVFIDLKEGDCDEVVYWMYSPKRPLRQICKLLKELET